MDVYIFERDGGWFSGPPGALTAFPAKAGAYAHAREVLRSNAPGTLINGAPPEQADPDPMVIDALAENPGDRWIRLAGPPELGRSILLAPGAEAPEPWLGCDVVRVEDLDGEAFLAESRRRFLNRTPTIYEVEIHEPVATPPPDSVNAPREVWAAPTNFEFATEAAWQLVTASSVDGRNLDAPIWPLTAHAMTMGAPPSDRADIVLAGGDHAYLDGGPFYEWNAERPIIPAICVEAALRRRGSLPESTQQLAPDQLGAVAERSATSRIIAPAGSGKTRVLTERARHLIRDVGVSPERLTLVAYNKRAQEEMRERTGDLPQLQIQTLNALALAIINGTKGFARRDAGASTIDERQVRDLLGQLVKFPRRTNTDPAAAWMDALSSVRLGLRDPEDVESDFGGEVSGFAEFFPRYRDALTRRGLVDFDEQIYRAIEVLLTEPAAREQAQARCQMMLVDEFQDLTPAHLLLIGLVSGSRRNVFGVGDDDQTIYGYSGASPHWLISFDKYFPGSTTHALEVNYRCPTPVVDAARNLLSHNRLRVWKEIRPAPGNSGHADSLRVEPTADPVAATVERVGELISQGSPPSDIAVLCRVNALLVPLQVGLDAKGVPTNCREQSRFLERSGVAAALAWIDLATTTGGLDGRTVRSAARRPGRAISPRVLDWMQEHRTITDLRAMADRLKTERDQLKVHGFLDDVEMLRARALGADTAALVEVIRAELGGSGLDGSFETLDSAQRGRNKAAHSDDLRAVASLARMHPDPRTFSGWLEQSLRVPNRAEGVELSTVHRVKGLEWPHVVVHDATQGILPHRLSTDLEEERRVFHVALTRSSESTTVVADNAAPSPFITELAEPAPPSDTVEPPDPRTEPSSRPQPSPGRPSRRSSGLRTATNADGQPNSPVVGGLKEWRRKRATTDGVPAFVILHDSTIDEIATNLPTTDPELLAIGGIGPGKLENYGDEILAIVAEHRPAAD